MELEIEYLDPAELLPYARNARTHSPTQVAKIAASIKEFGFNNPILLDSGNGVVAGHGRLLAAQKLKMDRVPCVRLEHLSETQKKAYILADNRLALDAGWDQDLLALELQELSASEFDLNLIGFDAKEIGELLAHEVKPGETEADAIPDIPATSISVLGDIWKCGNHLVICGDSADVKVLEQLCGDHKADMIMTDPPYGVDFERGKFQGNNDAPKFAPIANDKLKGESLIEFIRSVFAAAYAVTKDGAAFYSWSAPLRPGAEAHDGIVAAGWKVQSQVIWKKTPFVMGRCDYHWQHEPAWYGFKDGIKGGHAWYGGRDKASVWEVPKPQKMEFHPTTKPVELFSIGIKNSSKPGDIVLDMFGGSGTTMIACEQLGRHARLVELEPVYVDVIVTRWQQFTGQKAVLVNGMTIDADGNGKMQVATFDEAAAIRGRDAGKLQVKVGGKKKK